MLLPFIHRLQTKAEQKINKFKLNNEGKEEENFTSSWTSRKENWN
jgi:hypothetical protein